MRRLLRDRVAPPADWRDRLARNLPDVAAFERRAAAFEAEPLGGPVRQRGFKSYAPQVLKQYSRGPGFPALWGQAKGALAAMSLHKCAYCESPINAARSGQVEHFRPKSLFPSLCYDWGNYFLACNGCNG